MNPSLRQTQTDRRNAVLKIALINVLSVLAILPYCLHMEVKNNVKKGNVRPCPLYFQWSVDSEGVEKCTEIWSGPGRKIFGIFTFISQFLVPLVISAYAYVMILLTLHRHSQSLRPRGIAGET